jgi:hypothetical protein
MTFSGGTFCFAIPSVGHKTKRSRAPVAILVAVTAIALMLADNIDYNLSADHSARAAVVRPNCTSKLKVLQNIHNCPCEVGWHLVSTLGRTLATPGIANSAKVNVSFGDLGIGLLIEKMAKNQETKKTWLILYPLD